MMLLLLLLVKLKSRAWLSSYEAISTLKLCPSRPASFPEVPLAQPELTFRSFTVCCSANTNGSPLPFPRPFPS